MMVTGWQLPDAPLRASAVASNAIGLAGVAVLAWAARAGLHLDELYPFKAGAMFATAMLIAIGFLHRHHPFARFGPANQVTTARAMIVALLAALIGDPGFRAAAVGVAVAALAVTALDAVDGWLARRSRMASHFGARFDMEIDALLILVLSVLAWRYDKAGPWVVASGLTRYLFVAAGWVYPWLRAPLLPSRRRQALCVVQTVGLTLVILPAVTPPLSVWLSAVALSALLASFLVDVLWLWRNKTTPVRRERPVNRWWRWFTFAAALLLLDASLTFHSAWPTPAVRWRGELSIELVVCLLAFAAARRWFGPPSRAAVRTLGAVWVLLVIGRYAEVTAPALYGRDINLYWDLRYIPDVAAMLAHAAPAWLVLLMVAAAALALFLLYGVFHWALGRIGGAVASPRERWVLGLVAAAAAALFVSERVGASFPGEPRFSAPVTGTYARQARLVMSGLTGSTAIAASPPMSSDLARVKGTDVFLLFLESYGAVSYERPELAERLAPARVELEAAIRETGRDVVSAYVESPTFGGSSWLAHLTLLSGIDVRDADTNALLMTQKRDTLVTTFARHGYRTVALMPGVWQPWPEGAFYGFDDIYEAARFQYRGPQFGWFAIPDQVAIARLDQVEVSRQPRAPLFVFFPTTSSHTPFIPAPPYQADWQRVLTDRPFDAAAVEHAFDQVPDWMNLGPGYVDAMTYEYASLSGYLRLRADRDFVMILLGDHQPPAAVSGEGARWDVPVHVIASRRQVLDRLLSHGFRTGLAPARPSLGRLHGLLPMLLDAFGDQE